MDRLIYRYVFVHVVLLHYMLNVYEMNVCKIRKGQIQFTNNIWERFDDSVVISLLPGSLERINDWISCSKVVKWF